MTQVTPRASGAQVSAGRGPALSGPVTHTHRARIGSWTRSALRDIGYAVAIFGWSIAAFTILVTGVAVTASLLFLVVGVLVWIGFAYVMRWTTWVDRRLAGWQRGQPLAATYRRPATRGVTALVKTLTSDPQTWRDLAWMALTSIVGFASGLAVVTAAGVSLTYLSMPLWYWAIDAPADHHGLTNVGLFTVDTLGQAVVMSMVGLLLAPAALWVARTCARVHVRLAVQLLGRAD